MLDGSDLPAKIRWIDAASSLRPLSEIKKHAKDILFRVLGNIVFQSRNEVQYGPYHINRLRRARILSIQDYN